MHSVRTAPGRPSTPRRRRSQISGWLGERERTRPCPLARRRVLSIMLPIATAEGSVQPRANLQGGWGLERWRAGRERVAGMVPRYSSRTGGGVVGRDTRKKKLSIHQPPDERQPSFKHAGRGRATRGSCRYGQTLSKAEQNRAAKPRRAVVAVRKTGHYDIRG